MNGNKKGGSFEREVCKLLSLWWSDGGRDDIFWRSSQSGGRATQRAKKGQTTFGSYGDVAAVDPIGQPLLRLLTIEIKRGRSHGFPDDLMDVTPLAAARPFQRTLEQVIRSAEQAGTPGWMIINRRDRRQIFVYIDFEVARLLIPNAVIPRSHHIVRIGDRVITFVGVRLDTFFRRVTRGLVISATKQLLGR